MTTFELDVTRAQIQEYVEAVDRAFHPPDGDKRLLELLSFLQIIRDQLPKQQRILVVGANRNEFDQWCSKHRLSRHDAQWRYVTEIKHLYGYAMGYATILYVMNGGLHHPNLTDILAFAKERGWLITTEDPKLPAVEDALRLAWKLHLAASAKRTDE